MNIETVKLQENGYLVNGNMHVPEAEGNRHYRMVLKWIAEGNTPEAQYTEAELLVKQEAEVKELEAQEWRDYLKAEEEDKKLKWEELGKPKFKDK